jgi:hypothetical protein
MSDSETSKGDDEIPREFKPLNQGLGGIVGHMFLCQ